MAALIGLDKQLEYPSCKKKLKEQAKKRKRHIAANKKKGFKNRIINLIGLSKLLVYPGRKKRFKEQDKKDKQRFQSQGYGGDWIRQTLCILVVKHNQQLDHGITEYILGLK